MLNKPASQYSVWNKEITPTDVLWALIQQDSIPLIYRFDGNGSILQIICLGALNLSFSTTISLIKVLSETDFLLFLDLSLLNGNISVSQTSGTDLSMARISTDLTVQYNLMLDYNNAIDFCMDSLLEADGEVYILSYSISNGYIFTKFASNNDQIDLQRNSSSKTSNNDSIQFQTN